MCTVDVARQAFNVCGRHFPSKSKLEAEAKRIRNTQPLGKPLSTRDRDFLYEVFRQLYPKFEKYKLGVGVDAITVTEKFGQTHSRCFQFHTKDGRIEEPSLRFCFAPWEADQKVEANKAFRFEILKDIHAYRDEYFARNADELGFASCELSGRVITSDGHDCEVDHAPPNTFKEILASFLSDRGIDLETIPTTATPDGVYVTLTDRSLAADWRQYHRERATLRVLSKEVHVDLTREAQQLAMAG